MDPRNTVYLLELVGEDDAFAAYEAASRVNGVRTIAPGVAIGDRLQPRIDTLALTRRVDAYVGDAEGTDAARELLESAELDRAGSVAVRARAIRGERADTQQAERTLGTVLVDRGFRIDLETPDHELRVIFSDGRVFLGWAMIEPGDNFMARRPTKRPFFQPGSMAPRLARALVNIAGVTEESIMLDPMCGTGGLLVEASVIGARAIGIDVQTKMVRGSLENCRAYGRRAVAGLRGDARALPMRDRSVDALVFDAPYGRQSLIAGTDPDILVAEALEEANRVSTRAVVVADRPIEDLAGAAGWTVCAHFERRVHRSLTRHVHDLAQPPR